MLWQCSLLQLLFQHFVSTKEATRRMQPLLWLETRSGPATYVLEGAMPP